MRKSDIENACISGIGVDGRDVARVARNRRVIHLRHSWQYADGRVIDGVTRAWRRLSQLEANRSGKSIEVYTAGGNMLAHVTPEEA